VIIANQLIRLFLLPRQYHSSRHVPESPLAGNHRLAVEETKIRMRSAGTAVRKDELSSIFMFLVFPMSQQMKSW